MAQGHIYKAPLLAAPHAWQSEFNPQNQRRALESSMDRPLECLPEDLGSSTHTSCLNLVQFQEFEAPATPGMHMVQIYIHAKHPETLKSGRNEPTPQSCPMTTSTHHDTKTYTYTQVKTF